MKSYIKYPNNRSEKFIWIEVETESIQKYGRDRFIIKPIAGEGQIIVDVSKVFTKPVSGEGEIVIQADKVIIK